MSFCKFAANYYINHYGRTQFLLAFQFKIINLLIEYKNEKTDWF